MPYYVLQTRKVEKFENYLQKQVSNYIFSNTNKLTLIKKYITLPYRSYEKTCQTESCLSITIFPKKFLKGLGYVMFKINNLHLNEIFY